MTGQLITIVGAMGAGKTKRLIHTYEDCVHAGSNVLVFKPKKDTRSAREYVQSRDGRTAPAIAIHQLQEIHKFDIKDCKVILIDEIQFFNQPGVTKQLLSLVLQGIEVVCFGLDLTSDGVTFGKMGDILAISDEVVKLRCNCARCKGLARVSSYKGSDKSTEVKIGDLDDYEPLCYECFNKQPNKNPLGGEGIKFKTDYLEQCLSNAIEKTGRGI